MTSEPRKTMNFSRSYVLLILFSRENNYPYDARIDEISEWIAIFFSVPSRNLFIVISRKGERIILFLATCDDNIFTCALLVRLTTWPWPASWEIIIIERKSQCHCFGSWETKVCHSDFNVSYYDESLVFGFNELTVLITVYASLVHLVHHGPISLFIIFDLLLVFVIEFYLPLPMILSFRACNW